ncbi:Alpha-protein kinase 1 [Durusdinium trenchii]|uniref:Alpha-protein kinase 1 n=1 Tax=Durusdinium trenchii TaxID=1381693 RepID=A0ABP0SCF8_9DINO
MPTLSSELPLTHRNPASREATKPGPDAWVAKFLAPDLLEVMLWDGREMPEPGEKVSLLLAPIELLSFKRRKRGEEMDAAVSAADMLSSLSLSRIVVDEFHEHLHVALQLQQLKDLTETSFWGLTGTPCLDGFLPVAELLRACSAVDLMPFRRQLDAHALAQRALEYMVRANGNLDGLEVHEELVSLYQTPAERAIYVHLANRHRPRPSSGDSDSRPEENDEKEGTLGSELLQLCSHFRLDGPSDCDAETESAALLRRRKDACETSRAWLLLAAQKMEMHILQAQQAEMLPTLVAEQYAQLLAEVDGGVRAVSCERTVSQVEGAKAARSAASKGRRRHEREADALILQAILEVRSEPPASAESAEVVEVAAGLELLEEVKQAKEAFRQRSYEHAFLSAMLDAAEAQNFQCPVCLNEPPPTERAILAACAHLFCLHCAGKLRTQSRGILGRALLALAALAGPRLAWLFAEGRRNSLLSASLALAPRCERDAVWAEELKEKVEKTQLQLRFNGTEVEKLPSGFIAGWGPDDLYYPPWMEGRWRVVQTLEGYAAPMGKQFLANGQSAVAEKVLSEQQSQLGKPVSFELRNNIVEDRAFNTRAKLNAFAGREVVKSVEYVDVPDNTRESTMQGGNGPQDPLRTVIVNFKGAVQKIFITALQFEDGSDGDVWRGLASTRTLFAAPGAGYNPLTVDEEVVTALRKTDAEIKGRLRLLGFLNPNDQLFFKAGNRAVSIADYSLKFEPIKDSE